MKRRASSILGLGAPRFSGAALLAVAVAAGCGCGHDGGSCPIPGGSYAASCSSVVCADDELRGECREQDGSLSAASLSLPCGDSVTNCNGELVCGACPPLPVGSFLQTCGGCVASHTKLTCLSCRDEAGDFDVTSVELPCDLDVANCDGVLVCGGC